MILQAEELTGRRTQAQKSVYYTHQYIHIHTHACTHTETSFIMWPAKKWAYTDKQHKTLYEIINDIIATAPRKIL